MCCHVTTRKPRLPQCIMGDDLHINKQTNICIANHTRLLRQNNLSVFCRTNSPSIDQSRTEGNNTECVGKKRFNGLRKEHVLRPPFLDKVLHHFCFLMVICNSLLLLKSLPINIINCIILFSIRNPYINRFTNHLSIYS
jgi:hypothetical protein